jgi:hypothetical protein
MRRNGCRVRAEEVPSIEIIFARRTPRDHLSCHPRVPRDLVTFTARPLAAGRHRRGVPRGSRALNCFWQAAPGLRWFRDGRPSTLWPGITDLAGSRAPARRRGDHGAGRSGTGTAGRAGARPGRWRGTREPGRQDHPAARCREKPGPTPATPAGAEARCPAAHRLARYLPCRTSQTPAMPAKSPASGNRTHQPQGALCRAAPSYPALRDPGPASTSASDLPRPPEARPHGELARGSADSAPAGR